MFGVRADLGSTRRRSAVLVVLAGPWKLLATEIFALLVDALADAAAFVGVARFDFGLVGTVVDFAFVVFRMLRLPMCCDGNRTVTGRGPGRLKQRCGARKSGDSNALSEAEVQHEDRDGNGGFQRNY